jgi:signal transduction histidine kinase
MDWKSLWDRMVAPDPDSGWARQRFLTRARSLFYARLAFLAIGLGILAIPRWSHYFGVEGPSAYGWYMVIILYSVLAFLLVERGWFGKAFTFVSMCFDLLVLVYMVAASGGLQSPVLPTQAVYTIFFALLFPNPLSILPPLLTLPVVAKIDTELPGRVLELEDVFMLVWYSTINFIVVYVIVYLNEREESQHNEIVSLQKNLGRMAVTEERNRISREIHDGLGASLSTLIIQTEYLYNMTDDNQLKKEIQEVKEVAEESIDDLRRSISMMREDFELVPTVEDYCANFGQRSDIEVDFEVRGRLPRFDGRLQMAIFRVLQEALSNVRKHARAGKVEVGLVYMSDRLVLTVKDDGVGFEYGGAPAGHYGLSNMRERARRLGGDVHIETHPGAGCRIEFNIPAKASGIWEAGSRAQVVDY